INQSTIYIGHQLVFDHIFGPSFQERPVYGHISYISHYVKAPPLSSIIYLLSYHSLPKPSFTQYLRPSHPLYDTLGSPGGSQLSRSCRIISSRLFSQCVKCYQGCATWDHG
ncbi:hypothetical protein BYT27DRAFT_7205594, partial [Phlegmacium glaucopus]